MKTALITGCNRGLGKALLEKFVAEGYNVIACSRKKLEGSYGDNVTNICFDLSNPEEIEKGLDSIEALGVQIDVLVNNAGISIMKPLFYVEKEDLESAFAVNYFAPVMITKRIASLMMRNEDGGAIVNITSMGSLGHQAGGACYDASKAALNQFTITAAQELAPLGIRVNAVACGPIDTDMFRSLPEKAQKKLEKATALGRVAEPREICEAVYMLASEKASFITGQIVRVDGGATI